MTQIDVLTLSNEIEQDSLSGRLSRELLEQGHTLYSPSTYSEFQLSRILPDGICQEGDWINGQFITEFCAIK